MKHIVQRKETDYLTDPTFINHHKKSLKLPSGLAQHNTILTNSS